MGYLSLVSGTIGLSIFIASLFGKQYLLAIFGLSIFLFGVWNFINILKSNKDFINRCNKDISILLKNPTKENLQKINQIKLLRDLY